MLDLTDDAVVTRVGQAIAGHYRGDHLRERVDGFDQPMIFLDSIHLWRRTTPAAARLLRARGTLTEAEALDALWSPEQRALATQFRLPAQTLMLLHVAGLATAVEDQHGRVSARAA